MLSIIWVATITGLALRIHLRMISFWIMGTCSTGTSTPKSPLATITPSLSTMISRMFFRASGISILEITLILLFLSLIRFLRSMMSLALRTKERATQSNSFSIIKSRSARSFSVNEGIVSAESGRFTPFLGVNIPPKVTDTRTSLSFKISSAFNSILPSSKNIRSPTFTSCARFG